jgi:hypothetical protein
MAGVPPSALDAEAAAAAAAPELGLAAAAGGAPSPPLSGSAFRGPGPGAPRSGASPLLTAPLKGASTDESLALSGGGWPPPEAALSGSGGGWQSSSPGSLLGIPTGGGGGAPAARLTAVTAGGPLGPAAAFISAVRGAPGAGAVAAGAPGGALPSALALATAFGGPWLLAPGAWCPQEQVDIAAGSAGGPQHPAGPPLMPPHLSLGAPLPSAGSEAGGALHEPGAGIPAGVGLLCRPMLLLAAAPPNRCPASGAGPAPLWPLR